MKNTGHRAITRFVLIYALSIAIWGVLASWCVGTLTRSPNPSVKYGGLAMLVSAPILLWIWFQAAFRKVNSSERLPRESEMLRSQFLLRAVVEGTSDAIFVKDTQGRYILSNASTCRILGKPQNQILGNNDTSLMFAADAARVMALDQSVLSAGISHTCEEEITLEGEVHTFLTTKGPVRDAEGRIIGLFGIARDITGRQHSAKELARLNRALRTLCNCNQALVHATDEPALLQELCSIAVERGGYRMAWVGFAENDPAKTVRPVAQAGYEEGYLASLKISWADVERGRGPVGTAIRTGKPFVIRNIMQDAAFAPWRTEALKRGYASAASFPLLKEERQPFGALSFYSATPDAFDDKEVALLTELADDLSYGLLALRIRIAHTRAEAALRESERKYRELVEHANSIILRWDRAGHITFLNEFGQRFFGYSENEILGKHVIGTIVPLTESSGRDLVQLMGDICANPKAFELSVNENMRRNGDRVWISWTNRVVLDERGELKEVLSIGSDITERRRAEMESQREREFSGCVLNSLPGIFYCYDENRNFLRWNKNFERVTGYGASDVKSLRPADLFAEEDKPLLEQRVQDAFEKGAAELEADLVAKNGERTAYYFTGLATIIDGRKHLVGTGIDVSARKRAEQALLEKTRQLELALHAAHMGVWRWDLRTHRGTTTHPGGPISGLPEDMRPETTDSFLQLIHPEDRANVVDRLRRACQSRESYDAEFRIVLADQIRWVAAHGKCSSDGVLVGVDLDITKRKQAETERDRFFNLSIDMLCISRFDGFFKQVNPAWTRTLGWSETELLKRPWIDFVHPDDRERTMKCFKELAAGTTIVGFPTRYFCKDGTFRWISWNSLPLPLEGVAFGVARDITEQKRAEEEVCRLHQNLQKYAGELEQRVRQRTAQLELSNQELEAFSYSVSHDLRAPLRAIDGWSLAFLEDYGNQLDATGQHYLERVRSETQRLCQLIDDLLQLARVTRVEMHAIPVDLSGMVETIATRIRSGNPHRQIDFVIQPGVVAHGDPQLLEVVLTNLLENAAKFTSKRPKARIEFGTLPQPSSQDLTYFIRDNGAGFDMACAQKLFGAFQRMHKASEFPGTGVGLATVSRIIQRHGGRIWAEACPDKGATFFFTIAARDPE